MFVVGVVITIISQIFSLYTPRLIGDSVRAIEAYDLSKGADKQIVKDLLFTNVLLILGTTLAAGFFAFLMRQTLIVMSRKIEFDLKNVIFKQYQVLSLGFYKKNRTGDLMNRITEDVSKVRMYVGPAVMQSINTIIRFSVVIVQMYVISPKLTFYTLLPLPVLSYAIYKVSKAVSDRSKTFQEQLSKLSSLSQELFSGIRVIKAYGTESHNETEIASISEEMKDKNLSLVRANAFFAPLMILLIGSSSLLVIYIGGTMYINGSIDSIGVIAEFIIYVNMLTWPVASIGWITSLIKEAEVSQVRINEFLKIVPEIKNESETASVITGEIEFKQATMVYEDTGVTGLDKFSLKIQPGQTVVVLGNTGSGKSTLLTLISRLYDCTDGMVLIDGKPIKEVNLKDLRTAIGAVPQDAFLFSDTIRNNIKFGDVDATDAEVEEVAKLANIHDDIMSFSNQYDTVLGERGLTLSGGQKQRLSIARTLIKKQVKILLFDDCLSAVDTETEKKILKSILSTGKDKTTIIVSHRVSTAKYADKIIVLDKGRIIQQGTHQELRSQEGYYKDLCAKQRNKKE